MKPADRLTPRIARALRMRLQQQVVVYPIDQLAEALAFTETATVEQCSYALGFTLEQGRALFVRLELKMGCHAE